MKMVLDVDYHRQYVGSIIPVRHELWYLTQGCGHEECFSVSKLEDGFSP